MCLTFRGLMQDKEVVLVSSPTTGDHCSVTSTSPKSVCNRYQPEISDASDFGDDVWLQSAVEDEETTMEDNQQSRPKPSAIYKYIMILIIITTIIVMCTFLTIDINHWQQSCRWVNVVSVVPSIVRIIIIVLHYSCTYFFNNHDL